MPSCRMAGFVWQGIGCSAEPSQCSAEGAGLCHIVSLELAKYGMEGEIPSEVGNLTHLQVHSLPCIYCISIHCILHCIVLYCIVLYYIALYCIVLYYIALYYIAMCIVYCIVLFYPCYDVYGQIALHTIILFFYMRNRCSIWEVPRTDPLPARCSSERSRNPSPNFRSCIR
jgi:hypothetical protein